MNRFFLVLLMAAPSSAADREYAPLPKPLTSFGAAVSDGHVYVYGGHSGKAHTYSTDTANGWFLRLDLAKPAKWEELPEGPKLQGLAVVAHEGKIYRIGGMQPRNRADEKADSRSLPTVARFDIKSGKWEDLPDLPDGRSSHDAALLGDQIYVAGGWKMNGAEKSTDWHSTMLVLDLKKQPLKWESLEQPFKRRALTMAALDGKIYVIAGLAEDGKMERTVNVYDPAKKAWSTIAEIPAGQMNGFTPAACVCDGSLYVNPADGKVYRLSDKGTWIEAASLKQPRFVHRVVPVGKNALLAIGGSSHKGAVNLTELIAPGY